MENVVLLVISCLSGIWQWSRVFGVFIICEQFRRWRLWCWWVPL